ncbi:hypothetical protein [Nigerium massiliense]|uniref:hypothetical protein n=1 Tax=Nigerium massiliense TaxID=1522317 RepID=UPI00058AE232|nr:hypothetical protein [Nigerium massiliense]
MNSRTRFIVGLLLLLLALVGGGAAVAWIGNRPQPLRHNPITLTCAIGSEKNPLVADPEVKRLLSERYGITLETRSMGSYDQVLLPTEEIRSRGFDCLWPSSASALGVFQTRHAGAFPEARSDTALQSPLVVYAGVNGTAALEKAALVEKRDGRHDLLNVKSLLLDHVDKGATWEGLGASELRGPVNISSTDPARSNSGFTLSQLELTVLATQDVTRPPSLEQAQAALPRMRQIYDAQGLQASSSDNGFRQWLTQGGEFSAPLYAGYENQIIQQVVSSGASRTIVDQVRVLYPDPTIYSDHPVIALNSNAYRLIDALNDEEIQKRAWEGYGFRSARNADLNDVSRFPDLPLLPKVRVIPPPSGEVTLALIDCLNDRSQCS